jgi:hypothetical protein
MKIVADKLKELALASSIDHEIDQYGRSAFNRYYYAVYLIVRSKLMDINPSWARSPHKNIPCILTKRVYPHARKQAMKLERAGQITQREKSNMIHSIRICVEELSKVLETAYAARLKADYSPEEKVRRVANSLELSIYKIGSAQGWPERAARNAGQLAAKWRRLGL